jgi:hypothetical protein
MMACRQGCILTGVTVCAIASRFYSERPTLYGQCMKEATKIAFDIMVRGNK